MIRAKTAEISGEVVRLDALPDPADFRDRMYLPNLDEVPVERTLAAWQDVHIPVFHQGTEGSCTGFALMTAAHFLLRTRRVGPDPTVVSPRMFYEMAKRYDEWPGEDYEGSSARGAMKGWHKHGVCSADAWPYVEGATDRELTTSRALDALKRPLGAYFRVNQRDLVSLHSAITEAGVIFATAMIHEGWREPNADGYIAQAKPTIGGHAFVLVGYNADGFWVQNSWGAGWGLQGCALITYDDWLENAMDTWVARLGVPVNVHTAGGTAAAISPVVPNIQAQPLDNARRFLISIERDGTLQRTGTFATTEADVARIFNDDIPTLTRNWPRKRLLLYAHAGLTSEEKAVERAMEFGTAMAGQGVYPLVFLWRTDFWTVVAKILQEALDRRQYATDCFDHNDRFMLERLDTALEPLVRTLNGRMLWEESKSIGTLAMRNENAAVRIVLRDLVKFLADNPETELHMVAHSAGAVFFAPLVQMLTTPAGAKIEALPMRGRSGLGYRLKTCTLWAPALTLADFRCTYLPALERGDIERLSLYTLSDRAERDDNCVHLYGKSFLYLVSNALEVDMRIPIIAPEGTPLLGMERHLLADPDMMALINQGKIEWVIAPNGFYEGSVDASGATSHDAFDRDQATFLSTLARIEGIT